MSLQQKEPLLIINDLNGIRTICFNKPTKLNGWSPDMMTALLLQLEKASADVNVQAVVLTGAGKYYCAGVDFAGSIRPMHPRTMKKMIAERNQMLFDAFLDFKKPLIAAVNGPAIGAAVTSATLCDVIVASDQATFLTPFDTLGLVPEGCSSYTFPQKFGDDMARTLFAGKKLEANEAKSIGLAQYVIPHDQLMVESQKIAEQLAGKPRYLEANNMHVTLKKVNEEESVALANAILDYPFLNHMCNFTYTKKKYAAFIMFWLVRFTRPLWSRL